MRCRTGLESAGSLAMIAGLLFITGCGGNDRLGFYTSNPGNFRVIAAGTPVVSSQSLSTPAGQLSVTSVESVDSASVRRIVVYTDLPSSTVQSSTAETLLDGGLRGIAGSRKWKVERQEPVTLDGHPGREVRFAIDRESGSARGTGQARFFLVGNRLYQAIMVGPSQKVSEEELDHFLKSFELLQKVEVARSPAPAAPAGAPPPAAAEAASIPAAGPAASPPAMPAAPPAPIAPVVTPPILPAMATAEPASSPQPEPEPATGSEFGSPPDSRPDALAQADAPAAAPAPGANPPPRKSGRPTSARRLMPEADRTLQIGNVGPDTSKPAEVAIQADRIATRTSEGPLADGNPNERFREVAPGRALLVGLRVAYVPIFGGPKVAAIQAVYQEGQTYVDGSPFGKEIPMEMTILARPGYAIGGIHTRTGLTVDAFRVIFMRFHNGRLDPGDAYMSDWLGDPRGGSPKTILSAAKPVIGIHGRTNGREINMLGLLAAEK